MWKSLVLRYFWWKQIQRSSWVFLGRFVHVKHVDFSIISVANLQRPWSIPLHTSSAWPGRVENGTKVLLKKLWRNMQNETPQKIHRKPRKKKKKTDFESHETHDKKTRWKFRRANINPTFPSLPTLWERPSLTVFVFGSLFDASVGIFGSWEPSTGTNHQEKIHGCSWKKKDKTKKYPSFFIFFHWTPNIFEHYQKNTCNFLMLINLTPRDRRSRGATFHTATSWRQKYIQPGTPKIWNHPIETTIYKCLFQVQRISKSKIAFMDSNWYFSIQGIQVLLFCYINYLRSFTLWRQKKHIFFSILHVSSTSVLQSYHRLHLQSLLWTSLFGSSPFLFLLLARPPAPRRTSLDPFVDVETSEPPGRISFVQCGFYDIKILGQRLQH